MTSSLPEPGKSLADLHPDVASEWHPTKNGDLAASEIRSGSNRRVWWLGACGHEWDAPPTSRTTKRSGCPVCVGKRVVSGINDLATLNPEIAAEWHPTKNGDLTPEQVVLKSDKRVWWLGACGHEWDVKVIDRVQYKTGCPFCRGNLRVLPGVNDLATLQPLIATEWHPEKNGDLQPTNVRENSVKKVWWLGACGHEWLSTVAHRSNGRKCPICAGKKVLSGHNDITSTDPLIAAEWHPTKNGELTSEQVTRGSDRMVWWLSHGHEWRMTVSSRSRGQGCAICQGLQVQLGVNDLETTFPGVAQLWHPTKNGSLTPQQVTGGHGKKVWWLGDCGHTWTATVTHLTSGRGCAVCRGLQIEIGVNDLASQYPDVAAQWHPTKNGELTPHMVSTSSARKVWWLCDKGHEWRTGVNGRQYGKVGCPSCAIHGFSPDRDGWLYLLQHPIWAMQQIGISNVPEQRLSQHRRLGWEVLEVRGPMDGSLVKALESDTLRAIRRRGGVLGARSTSAGFDGHTEAWPHSTLHVESLAQIMSWIYEDDEVLSDVEFAEVWSPPPKESRTRRVKSGCSVEGCERYAHGRGYCRLHYRRFLASGVPGPTTLLKRPNVANALGVCAVDGCGRRPVGRELCSMHYARFMKSGDPGEAASRVKNMKLRQCVIEGCERNGFAKDMCELHYRRNLANGNPLLVRQGGKPKTFCSVADCDKPSFGHGLCNLHYKRWRKGEIFKLGPHSESPE
jgi:Probable Zinc-ribbon domain